MSFVTLSQPNEPLTHSMNQPYKKMLKTARIFVRCKHLRYGKNKENQEKQGEQNLPTPRIELGSFRYSPTTRANATLKAEYPNHWTKWDLVGGVDPEDNSFTGSSATHRVRYKRRDDEGGLSREADGSKVRSPARSSSPEKLCRFLQNIPDFRAGWVGHETGHDGGTDG